MTTTTTEAQAAELKILKAAYRRIHADNAHTQMGKRRLKEAGELLGRNADRVRECLGWARHHLPYAEALAIRARS